jgi:peptide/nickel transport system permease protein
MGRYALIKILLIIPSLFLLSLIVFFMSKIAPGDPVASVVELRGQISEEFNTGEVSPEYKMIARELNLDKPVFYFGIHPFYFPDTLYKYVHPARKTVLKAWLHQTGDWERIQQFIYRKNQFTQRITAIPDSILTERNKKALLLEIKQIDNTEKLSSLVSRIKELKSNLTDYGLLNISSVQLSYTDFQTSGQNLIGSDNITLSFLPKITYNGLENQYHLWLKKLLKMDFGESIIDSRSVTEKIGSAIGWTLFYVLIAYIISLTVAIPLGIYNAWNHGRNSEKIVSSLSFLFYAFPLFWIATLAAIFLTNGLYAPWLHIFPGIGIGDITPGMRVGEKIITAFPYLILPALLLALHSAASGIRIVRNSAFAELKNDYFITAKAKGLSTFRILTKHILPNAMLPVITLLVSSFPAAMAGSVVLEVIFNIPGMGRLLYDSILFMDWQVVFGILIIMGLLTFIFYLIGDLLYGYLNPKIKFEMK